MVATETMSASRTAASRSPVALTARPGRSRAAARRSAASGVRFQIVTCVIGRTAAWAAMRRGASAPAPIIAMRRAPGRARKPAANAEAAAVRHNVSVMPSKPAKGSPLSPASSR